MAVASTDSASRLLEHNVAQGLKCCPLSTITLQMQSTGSILTANSRCNKLNKSAARGHLQDGTLLTQHSLLSIYDRLKKYVTIANFTTKHDSEQIEFRWVMRDRFVVGVKSTLQFSDSTKRRLHRNRHICEWTGLWFRLGRWTDFRPRSVQIPPDAPIK